MNPTEFKFDGSTGHRDAAASDDGGSEFCFSALRFTAPKEAEDRGDSKVCTARAYLLPNKSAMRLTLNNASIAKVTHSRRDAHTAFVHVAASRRHSMLSEFLVNLDARVLQVAQSNTDVWFMHRMNADLVEEYYRGCSGAAGGAQGRFVLVAESLPPDLLLVAAACSCPTAPPPRLDLSLQLVGLQFRPQYFTCVWRIVYARLSPTPIPLPEPQQEETEAEKEKERPRERKPPRSMLFLDAGADEDEGADADADEDEDIGPSAEERAEMREALMARLRALEADHATRVDALRAMIRRLDTSSPRELIGALCEIEETLMLQ